MTSHFAVTFEFAQRAPLTHRGIVSGGQAWTLMHRAVQEAQRTLKPVGWTSVVCILLDREDSVSDGETGNLDEGTV